MAHEQNSPAFLRDLAHLPQALLLKRRVTDGQHFVHNQNLRIKMSSYGKGQAHVHPARIMLDWRVYEFVNFGEGDHLIKLLFDLEALHTEDRTVQKNVLAARKFRMKTRSNFE